MVGPREWSGEGEKLRSTGLLPSKTSMFVYLATRYVEGSVTSVSLDLVQQAIRPDIKAKTGFKVVFNATCADVFSSSYKQNKFNLLREQSEGYSKLTVELTSALGPGHIPSTARPPESFEAIQRRARPVWEKIISLIGFFDLDPNKALDIILDVMSVDLTSHYTFFFALLSFSPWARPSTLSYDESSMSTDPKPDQFRGKTLDEVLNLADPRSQWSNADMAPGSRVLAQILGFKLNYYQSTDVPETPKSLYLTAALLIREGLVALEDLYPHVRAFVNILSLPYLKNYLFIAISRRL